MANQRIAHRPFSKRHQKVIEAGTLCVDLPERARNRLWKILCYYDFPTCFQPDPYDQWTVNSTGLREFTSLLERIYGRVIEMPQRLKCLEGDFVATKRIKLGPTWIGKGNRLGLRCRWSVDGHWLSAHTDSPETKGGAFCETGTCCQVTWRF